jgi:predicted transcriptional regulator
MAKNNSEIHKKIGKWLKGKRKDAGLSQTKLGEMIGHCRSFVVMYEEGRRLEISEFLSITQILNADPHEVIEMVMKVERQGRKIDLIALLELT